MNQGDSGKDEARLKLAGRYMGFLYIILFTFKSLKFPKFKEKKF